ncbi:hypothetical protein OROHE_020485 [Orobanche hederae]
MSMSIINFGSTSSKDDFPDEGADLEGPPEPGSNSRMTMNKRKQSFIQ